MVISRKLRLRISLIALAIFLFMNIIAFFHAYKFTHFSSTGTHKTVSASKLSSSEKLKTALFGVTNPKPINALLPTQKFGTLRLQSNKMIECWSIPIQNSRGTVILFHGYGSNKSAMLDKSNEFIRLCFSTILVDFMGSGGSEGYQTTIGFKEAEQVKTVFDYLQQNGEKKIYLFGTSLGAVAIMKAISDSKINPKAIIIECPFGSMYQTTCARFESMNIPTFPMAGLLVFWGGIQNGFWAFGHNPTEYATNIPCPTLLLYGAKDQRVSRSEINSIYLNLKGAKKLIIYPNAGHENYLIKYKKEWIEDVHSFLTAQE
jgi:pimeloyl-ACP methyl ester carboxylesterase